MSCDANLTRIEDSTLEATTCLLTGTITEEDGVTGFQPTTCLLTLYDVDTGVVINSRTDSDILASVSAGGVLALALAPADNAILDATKALEWHRALIKWSWSAGSKKGAYTIEFAVRNHEKLP